MAEKNNPDWAEEIARAFARAFKRSTQDPMAVAAMNLAKFSLLEKYPKRVSPQVPPYFQHQSPVPWIRPLDAASASDIGTGFQKLPREYRAAFNQVSNPLPVNVFSKSNPIAKQVVPEYDTLSGMLTVPFQQPERTKQYLGEAMPKQGWMMTSDPESGGHEMLHALFSMLPIWRRPNKYAYPGSFAGMWSGIPEETFVRHIAGPRRFGSLLTKEQMAALRQEDEDFTYRALRPPGLRGFIESLVD